MTTLDTTSREALTSALNAEYAAVYLYALLGARAAHDGTPAEATRWKTHYAAHQLRRDQLLTFLGTNAPEPAVAYAPPMNPSSAAARTTCARAIEARSEPIYVHLIAATTGSQRAFAINALTAVSTAATALGQMPSAFPGLTLSPATPR